MNISELRKQYQMSQDDFANIFMYQGRLYQIGKMEKLSRCRNAG